MRGTWYTVLPLALLLPATAYANPSPAPVVTASPIPGATPAPGSGHPYDPCAMVSQQDVASAAGVAVNEVSHPQSPTKNECVWAVGNKAGAPGQQIALTVQTVDQVKQAHGMAKFGAILSAVQSVPGVSYMNNPVVSRVFSDAQVVEGLGDKAGWKNGTLSVLKNETLLQVNVVGGSSDSQSLAVAKSVATSALQNVKTQ